MWNSPLPDASDQEDGSPTKPTRFGPVASNQAGLWAIGSAEPDARTGRPTFRTVQLGLDGLDLSIPNQSHRDFETTALRSLKEGNWIPQEPAPEASEPVTLPQGMSAIDLSQGGSSFFGNLAGISSVVDISESDEDMGRGSDPEDVPVGPDAQAWEAFSAAAVAEDSMLNMEPPAAPALAICARRSVTAMCDADKALLSWTMRP